MATDSITIGRFTPPDFKVLSQRLEQAGVSFEIECDTSAPATNIEGSFSERHTVTVAVRSNDAASAAAQIIEDWCIEIGQMKKEEPNQSSQPTSLTRRG